MMDVQGKTLTEEDRELLAHPLVGAVILFTRNFESVEQLQQLVAEIRAVRSPPLLVTVDHEGGRAAVSQGFYRAAVDAHDRPAI